MEERCCTERKCTGESQEAPKDTLCSWKGTLWVRRVASEARLRRAVSLLQIPGRHGVQFSYQVMGSLKTEV